MVSVSAEKGASEDILNCANGEFPKASTLLGIIIRDYNDVLLPELSSARSITTANMIDALLRHLKMRVDAASHNSAVDDNAHPAIGHIRSGDTPATVASELACQKATESYENHLELPRPSPERSAALDITQERLAAYLSDHPVSMGRSVSVSKVTKLLSGFSKETFIVELELGGGPEAWVLRRDVPLGPVDISVEHEFPLIRSLYRMGLAVAEPILIERSPAFFGAPFSLTQKVSGTTVPNTSGLTVAPEHSSAARELAAFLGRLHSQDPNELDLPTAWFDPAVSISALLVRQIDAMEQSWKEHRHEISPTILSSFAWLRENMPVMGLESARIVHGDAGLSNLLVHEGKISAMIDWELAHPGDPVEDLAFARKWIDQVLPWDDFLSIYYKNGGPSYRVEREEFYEVLGDLRVAIYAVRCRDNVEVSPNPELSWAFASLFYRRYFIGKLGKRIMASQAAS